MLAIVRLIALLCLVAAAAVVAPLANAESSVDEQPGKITTNETNCFETLDRRPVLLSEVESYVPDAYTVIGAPPPPPPAWTGEPTATIANVGFIDYVCEALSVNGHQPQPTIVSIGTVLVQGTTTPTTWYVLWVGTDNPLLFARLQQLGVNAYFIPRSEYTETTNSLGQRVISVDYVGAGPTGLNYSRTITVLTAPSGPMSTSVGTMVHLGSRGEVSFTWLNTTLPTGRAMICFALEEGSIPTDYGLESWCYQQPRNFFRGSWEGTIQLLP